MSLPAPRRDPIPTAFEGGIAATLELSGMIHALIVHLEENGQVWLEFQRLRGEGTTAAVLLTDEDQRQLVQFLQATEGGRRCTS